MADRHEIDEVRARTDLVSVIEQYVTLKRTGKTYKGLCPFHNEKTPSFQVSPDLGLWHCFGQCSEGGDVFKFVQKIENLSFVEALERLALRAGVTLSRGAGRAEGDGRGASSELGERDRLYRANALALRYYREALGRSPEARRYVNERDIAHATQEAFSLGFAPESWEGLTQALTRQGVALSDAEKAGLVSKNDRGGYFDKLRGRLVFPIFDVQERPIAFGGRLIAGEAGPGQPKYWNSPETPVFSKSRTLYGLWRARKAIAAQGRAIIVEGYTDVIAAHQSGFENVVATLGTSLTEEHVKVLSRLASTVLLAFDADSAGLKAAFRAAEIFESQEVEVRVIALPPGEDPDSLLRAGKRQMLVQAMDNALPLIEYRIRRLIDTGPTESERDRVALFRRALPILAGVPSQIEREQYVKMLVPCHPYYSQGAAFAEEHIRQDVMAYQAGRGRYGAGTPNAASSVGRPASLPVRAFSATEQAEQHLLRALISGDAELTGRVLAGIMPDEFVSAVAQELAARIYDYFAFTDAPDLQELCAAVDDEKLSSVLAALAMEEGEPLTSGMLDDEIAHLKLRPKERERAQLKAKIDQGIASEADHRRFAHLYSEIKGTR